MVKASPIDTGNENSRAASVQKMQKKTINIKTKLDDKENKKTESLGSDPKSPAERHRDLGDHCCARLRSGGKPDSD